MRRAKIIVGDRFVSPKEPRDDDEEETPLDNNSLSTACETSDTERLISDEESPTLPVHHCHILLQTSFEVASSETTAIRAGLCCDYLWQVF